jgi:hypothetical protein
MKANLFCLLISLLLFSACEKPIDIDLNSSDPKIVIEGAISNVSGNCTVKLTRSLNFDEPNEFPPVSGAFVKISDDTGNTVMLNEISAGIYGTAALPGIPGRTYKLEVTDDGEVYTAISKMPFPVVIQSASIEEAISVPFEIIARFQDPPGISNYYRLTQVIERGGSSDIIVDDDRLQDGSTIALSTALISGIAFNGTPSLKSGDSVTVALQAIDRDVYEYLRMLNELQQEDLLGQPASYANPTSNISNGALGYFNAYSETSKTIVIP